MLGFMHDGFRPCPVCIGHHDLSCTLQTVAYPSQLQLVDGHNPFDLTKGSLDLQRV
jgi:hypothetical protein